MLADVGRHLRPEEATDVLQFNFREAFQSLNYETVPVFHEWQPVRDMNAKIP